MGKRPMGEPACLQQGQSYTRARWASHGPTEQPACAQHRRRRALQLEIVVVRTMPAQRQTKGGGDSSHSTAGTFRGYTPGSMRVGCLEDRKAAKLPI
eukprot:4297315-Prymnesium_polylepis.1